MRTSKEDHSSWGLRSYRDRHGIRQEPAWFRWFAVGVWVLLFVWALVSR